MAGRRRKRRDGRGGSEGEEEENPAGGAGSLRLAGGSVVGTAELPARHPLGGRAASPDPWRQWAGDIAAASGCWGWVFVFGFFKFFFLTNNFMICSWRFMGGLLGLAAE